MTRGTDLGLGNSDSLSADDGTASCGIRFSDTSVKESTTINYASVNDMGRYVMVKPNVSGTISFGITFDKQGSMK